MILNRLTILRKSNNWSLQETADFLGIAKSTYAGYESGHRRPSLEAIKLMADLFQTSTDYILGRVEDPSFQPAFEKTAIELADPLSVDLSVDGSTLSQEEIEYVIAFIRAKRELGQHREHQGQNPVTESSYVNEKNK